MEKAPALITPLLPLQAALGRSLKRLTQIKAKRDPANVFRTNRNITPA